MYLYYELCEKIWGGSPATEQMETGVETEEVNQQVDMGERGSDCDDTGENSEPTQLSDTSSQFNSRELSTSGDQSSQRSSRESSVSENQSGSSSLKRREKLDETLATYKHKRMKKRMSADAQMLQLAEKELELKQQMAERLETMSRDHNETMMVVTDNLKALSNTMSSAFSLLHQSLMQRSSASLPPYYNQYPYAPPPSPTLPGSSAPAHYHHSPSMAAPAAGTRSQSSDYEYSQVLFDSDS